jgi:ferric-chelate reductase
MDGQSVDEPLLLSRDAGYVRKTPLFVSLAKGSLKFVIWVVFIAWVALIFLSPTQFVNQVLEKWIQATSGSLFGITGWPFNLFYPFICFQHLIA